MTNDIKILSRHVSKMKHRPELMYVHVTPELMEATDSYSLLQVIPKEKLNVTNASKYVLHTATEDSYPDTKQITDGAKRDNSITVTLNMHYLKALMLSFTELERVHGVNGLSDVKFTVTDGMNPVVIEKWFQTDGTLARALLMPIRL